MCSGFSNPERANKGCKEINIINKNIRILIAEDNPISLRVLEKFLQKYDYDILTARDGISAYEILQKESVHLVILDWMMPGMDGLEICHKIRQELNLESVYIIFLTTKDEREDIIAGLEAGADDYITKPFNQQELHARMKVGSRVVKLQNRLAGRVKELEETLALRQRVESLQKTMEGTIKVISSIGEIVDPYTAGHQRRVAKLACAIAEEMGFSQEQLECLHIAGIVHDIGKIAVPIEILSKPGKISELEFAMIKTHSQVGYDILKIVDFGCPVAQIVLQHHERLDGSGYPSGITGGEILLEAKILAVADVVEAVASHRPYRASLGIKKALSIITDGKGNYFDEEAVDACLRVFENDFQFE